MTTMLYIETDIPAGMTVRDYRRRRQLKASRWQRFLKLFG